MSIRRITISVQETVARRIKRAAGAVPVSTWLTELALEHLDDTDLQRQWQAFCDDVTPTRAESRRAATIFGRLTKKRKRKAA
jgi:hypothetical protein